ncbi:hypothetical protein E8K88_02615 [Lampropedia aestuarii]|uniref:Uncharacterized protein n=1 Tax=Lampropedia aestuarii TaxID=2562762 RepID=A0A4S5BYL5_9BURK|nr:hypothetical protein [Lampropedia aestuarii]THJ36175.1 hypothetical protein E8K88_02615 [Lampropedia aestuarii]
MQVLKLKYSGRKVYTDRTHMAQTWLPGDVKAVTGDAGKELLRFVEFKIHKDAVAQTPVDEPVLAQTGAADAAKVLLAQDQQAQEAEAEHQALESTLTLLDSMDKAGLEAYAAKYEVNLDKRKSLADLREQVGTLVEQFGAR